MNPLFHRILRAVTYWEANRQVRRFESAARAFEKTQEKVLLEKIRRAEKSEFGRKYHFDRIKSIADFRRAVPLHTFEDAAPYLERVKRGELTALFPPSEKISMF